MQLIETSIDDDLKAFMRKWDRTIRKILNIESFEMPTDIFKFHHLVHISVRVRFALFLSFYRNSVHLLVYLFCFLSTYIKCDITFDIKYQQILLLYSPSLISYHSSFLTYFLVFSRLYFFFFYFWHNWFKKETYAYFYPQFKYLFYLY